MIIQMGSWGISTVIESSPSSGGAGGFEGGRGGAATGDFGNGIFVLVLDFIGGGRSGGVAADSAKPNLETAFVCSSSGISSKEFS